MGLELIEVTQAELDARVPAMIAGYAHDVTLNFGVAPEVALEQTAHEFKVGLPDGVATEGQLLWKAVDGGEEVGWLWISLPGTTYPDKAWISEIEVAEGRRGQGYGSRIMAAGEAEMLARGVRRMGLHVFGHNHGARRLYLRLGYRILAQVRSRPIEPEPDTDDDLTLVPMTQETYEERLSELAADDPARRLAPAGVATEGVVLSTAHVDGREVGWLWLSLPNPGRPTIGLVAYLGVDPAERRRGHGRRMMAAAEAELARHGVPRIGLTVPGRVEALAFADTLDMSLASQQMVKDL